jgi:hypothetical protein
VKASFGSHSRYSAAQFRVGQLFCLRPAIPVGRSAVRVREGHYGRCRMALSEFLTANK